jgi:nucleoside-diphosphate-sugar epimerase
MQFFQFYVTSRSIPLLWSTDKMTSKKALVCGAGGFIGSHIVKRLRAEGYWVRGADLKYPEFSLSHAHEFIIADLRLRESWDVILGKGMDEVYQFAADMGGAGYIFTGDNDAHVMHNSAMINLYMADFGVQRKAKKVFYSSFACIYPAYNQEDPDNPKCAEETVYPAAGQRIRMGKTL